MPRAPAKTLDTEGLMAYAARTLAARAQTSNELRVKLNRRAALRQDVDEVIGRLKDAGFLNDQHFAASYATLRRENEGFGKIRVMRDLMARRVAPALAKQAAETAYRETDEVAMIERFLARKYRGKDLGKLLAEEKHLASVYRRLRAAGFSSGNSIRVLKRYAALADQLEDLEAPEDS